MPCFLNNTFKVRDKKNANIKSISSNLILPKSFFIQWHIKYPMGLSPVLPKSRHTLKMMVSGLFVEFEITVNHTYDIILNTVTMRT